MASLAAFCLLAMPAMGCAQTELPDPDEILSFTTADLARLLLTPEQAALVVSHSFTIPHPASPPAQGYRDLEFFTLAEPLLSGTCRRSTYSLWSFNLAMMHRGRGQTSEPIEHEQVALGTDCQVIPNDRFAYVNPGVTEGQAGRLLLWLADIRERARQNDLPRGYVSCRSRLDYSGCKGGALLTLANLPLERTYIVDRPDDNNEGYELSVMPNGPGNAFYAVRVEPPGGSFPVISLEWDNPAPF